MLPMLRVGFVIAPGSLQPALHAAKQLADWRGDLVTQGALARFIDDGLLSRHIRKATRVYAARHELITTTLAKDFAPFLDVVPSVAGLHLCAYVRPDAYYEPVAWLETVHTGLVIGFGVIQLDQITPGLRRLARAFTR
jgi:GntR family transcriptional regulator/MocR family aminotransferase